MVVRRDVRPRRRRSGKDSGESEFEARLAPPEERSKSDDNDGRISVNTGSLKLPQELVEDDATPGEAAKIDPVVLAIFFLALIFIVVVAFVIWNGWEPPQ